MHFYSYLSTRLFKIMEINITKVGSTYLEQGFVMSRSVARPTPARRRLLCYRIEGNERQGMNITIFHKS